MEPPCEIDGERNTVIGIRGKKSVILVAEKNLTEPLPKKISYEPKIFFIDGQRIMAYTGNAEHGNYLVREAQHKCIIHKNAPKDAIPAIRLSKYVTKVGKKSNYDIGFIVGGFDKHGPVLYKCNTNNKTTLKVNIAVIGRFEQKLKEFKVLKECQLLSDEELIKFGIKAMLQVVEPVAQNLDIGFLSSNFSAHFLDTATITKYLEEVQQDMKKEDHCSSKSPSF